jgi:predicted nucleic acid-binding protein
MVDTNVVIDLLEANGPWLDWSLGQVLDARRDGVVAISAIAIGELATRFESHDQLLVAVHGIGMSVHDLSALAAHRAGRAQHAYRAAGGSRDRLLGDFLIGAHAETCGALLLTRDPRHYRTYFPELTIITPETEQ